MVVKRPALGAQYPVLRWFMTDADYAKEVVGTCHDIGVPAVISFGDQVVDNAQMRIKGHSSCTDTNNKWDISLPTGHLIAFGAPFQYPVDEFDANSVRPRPRSCLGDQGALVYVNRVEVARSNMPTGTISFTTKPAGVADGTAETTADVLGIPASALSVGPNTIAIEVHQKSTRPAGDLRSTPGSAHPVTRMRAPGREPG